jgi:hypothetical protein
MDDWMGKYCMAKKYGWGWQMRTEKSIDSSRKGSDIVE